MKKTADLLAELLAAEKVTDVFGIPGSEIMELIYALDRHPKIRTHLCYHEQGAAYAACGYAQASGRLGAAYATKGPGVTNMLTPMAEAYYGSFPVLFMTAHTPATPYQNVRIDQMKEMDPLPVVAPFVKYAVRIENPDAAAYQIRNAIKTAQEGRKGPVFLDFAAKLLETEIPEQTQQDQLPGQIQETADQPDARHENSLEFIRKEVRKAKRPVILIGDGLRHTGMERTVISMAEAHQIPILSSRVSQDLAAGSPNYYGYIGSHATRYSHFILSKADLVLALGNRMAYPVDSASFGPLFQNARVIRIDVDEREFARPVPNAVNIHTDLKALLPGTAGAGLLDTHDRAWLDTCGKLKEALSDADTGQPVPVFEHLLGQLPDDAVLVCDVGSNEMWMSRAYAHTGCRAFLLHAKFLEDLGSSLGKAAGAFYACGRPVVCVTGDQGVQFNIQELEQIALEQLPVAVVIVNNGRSGIIKNLQKKRGYTSFLHSTRETGFSAPDFQKLADAYGIHYAVLTMDDPAAFSWTDLKLPCIVDMFLPMDFEVQPALPVGNPCQKMAPALPEPLYRQLDQL